jgi:large subunit ribosomal protein L4
MVSVPLHGIDGTETGTVDLPDELFAAEVNVPAMHQVVTAQLAAARSGTSKTKTRGEVRGGGRKPWRQKGTGRARQGSSRSPQWIGGGVAHGPSGVQNHTKRVSKKLKKVALRSALSDRVNGGNVRVVDGLTFDVPRTKDAVGFLGAFDLVGRRTLLVLAGVDDNVGKSFRNLGARVHLLTVDQLNTYDVLVSDVVVFQAEAVEYIGTGTRRDLAEREARSGGRASEQDPAEREARSGGRASEQDLAERDERDTADAEVTG